MIEKKSVKFQHGAADSVMVSFESFEYNLLIYLKTWNDTILKFEFCDNIFFSIYSLCYVSDFCQVNISSNMDRALSMEYEKIPLEHPYKIFQFFNLNDDIAAEIICENLVISEHEDLRKKNTIK